MLSYPDPKRSAAAALCALLLAGAAAAPAAAAAPRIAPAALPGSGRGIALLAIDEPGRYAITATSGAGAALRLVDRESGPGPEDGVPGERDGRLDLLLDRGTYRVVTRGPERAPGEVSLAVREFRELSAPPPLLVEGRPVAAELGDLERRSWWLEVGAARRVVLEAAGRSLADLRLWRDGGWLVDAAPARATIEPEPGRPLRSCLVAARLEPGRYLVTAYGGPEEPWAAGGAEHPLHLRLGIPELAPAGRARLVAGPFGADHWILPGSANFVRIDLPASAAARLEARPFAGEGDPFLPAPEVAEISKQSREPFAELLREPSPGAPPRLVTVRARPGQPYLLQHFELREHYPLRASGRYWLGSVHTGHPGDAADATAVVVRADADGRREREPFLAQAVEVGEERGWARRFSLTGPMSVVVRAGATRTYEVLLRGTAARARILPYLVERPEGFVEPPWGESGGRWRLEAGLHELQLEPLRPGVAEVALRPAGRLDRIFDALAPGRAMPGDPVRAAAIFPDVALDAARRYEVRFARRPGVRTGLVLRELPLDLAQPLPLALRPKEEIAVPVTVAEPGALAAAADDGIALEVSVKNGRWGETARLGPGRHRVQVRNRGAATLFATLRFSPDRLNPATPLPALPPGGALAPPPAFPPLAEGEPRFLDLPRLGTATFALRSAAPAFALVESTGLLATEGTLRTRLAPVLARDAGGGSGRNFAIGRYLREGEYQLTVAALGASAGHLGVRLSRVPVREGGSLRAGIPARDTVAAGEGIAYDFTITEPGAYRLSSFALGRPLAGRIEDAEGWPIDAPGTVLDGGERVFEAGRHRLILPPEAAGSRRVTLLLRVRRPPAREGHGPHPLEPGGAPVEHRWLEPAAGGERTPDRWEFSLPAPATLTVTLTGEMEGVLARRGAAATAAAGPVRIHPGRPWTGPLPAGDYAIEAVCSRRNNQAPYQLSVLPAELLPGGERRLTAPGELAVSIGAEGLYELATSGPEDVSLRLLDAQGGILAEQEDRPDDWNAQLVVRLAPGAYRLRLEPSGAPQAAATVALRALAELPPERVAALPLRLDVSPGEGVALLPFVAPGEGAVLVLRAEAAETVGVALERAGGPGETLWTAAGRRLALELTLGDGERESRAFRIRVWSLDRRGGAVRLQVAAAVPARASERELARGVAVAPLPGIDPPIALLAARPERPGLFAAGGGAPWRWAGRAGAPLSPLGPEGAAAGAGTLFLAADLPAGAVKADLRATRSALPPGETAGLLLPPDGAVACDIASAGGGPLLATIAGVGGQPAVALAPQREVDGRRPSAIATAVADGAAAAILPSHRASAAILWRADGVARPLPVTLRVRSFPAAPAQRLAGGLASGSLPAGAAAEVELPRGPGRVRVTLAAGIAAALSRDGRPEAAFWAAGTAVDESVESSADLLTVVNPGDGPGTWTIEVLPLAGKERTMAVSRGWPLLADFTHAGTVRVPVAAESGPARTLHARGASGAPLLLGADGSVRRGGEIRAGRGGTLVLPHAPGTLVAWAESPGTPFPGLWIDGRPAEERVLAPPQVFPLKGSAIRLLAKTDRPVILHLRARLPVVSLVHRPAGAPEAGVHLDGARLDLPLAPGTTEIWLRAADGGDLRGRAEATLSPLTAIGEGAGPELIIAAGTARFFSFRVEREGPVGIGVRAEPDAADCRLLDGGGRVVATGPVQMPRLAPGDYLLAVRAPAGGGPVRIRPALAGIDLPPSGPPAEVVRGYRGMAPAAEETGGAPEEAPGEGD